MYFRYFSTSLLNYLPVSCFSFKLCLICTLMWLLLMTFFVLPFSCTDNYFKDTRRKKIKVLLVRCVGIILFDVYAKHLMRLFQHCKLRAHHVTFTEYSKLQIRFIICYIKFDGSVKVNFLRKGLKLFQNRVISLWRRLLFV